MRVEVFKLQIKLVTASILILIGCSGQKPLSYSDSMSSYSALNPTLSQKFYAWFNPQKTSSWVTLEDGTLSVFNETYAKMSGFKVPSTYLSPTRVTDSTSLYQLLFSNSFACLESRGTLPHILTNEFTALFVGKMSSNGLILRISESPTTNGFQLTKTSSGLELQHFEDTGKFRSRIYPLSGLTLTDNHIYAVVVGAQGKDIELYIDGFRQTSFNSVSVGTVADLAAVARIIQFGCGAQFSLGDFVLFTEKKDPKDVYRMSKHLSLIWSIKISESVSSEIQNATLPTIEPESLNYSYIASLVLTNKCSGCHQPGGTSPYLNSYTSLMSGSSAFGQVIVPGNAGSSRLYLSVLNDSMPQTGTKLTAQEKAAILDWINQGAPEN